MGRIRISELIRRPEAMVRVTPLQFLRVFELEWQRECERIESLRTRLFQVQRSIDFKEKTAQLQVYECDNPEGGRRSFKMVASVDAQIIPQRDADSAIHYALWFLPTDQRSRFLTILDDFESLSGEAARAVVVFNGLLQPSYTPSVDVMELAETSKKSMRGKSIKRDLSEFSRGGAATLDQAAGILGLNPDQET